MLFMAIKVIELVKQARGLVDDDEVKSEYYSDPFWLRAVNAAVRSIYRFCYDSTEYSFLLNTDIVISAADVTNKVVSYSLPARTIQVSDYCVPYGTIDTDYRPMFKEGVATTGSKLILECDYYLSSDKFVLILPPANSGNIEINYKALPARVTKITASITELPELYEDFLIEYIVWYGMRRLEDGRFLNDKALNDLALELRGIQVNLSGKPRQFEPNWPPDPDP